MVSASAQTTPPTRVLLAWWRRPFVREENPTSPPLQRLVADLRRLSSEAANLCEDTSILARGQRLIAVRLAYDMVLVDAARALLDSPAAARAPLTREQRFWLEIELTRAGLAW